MSFSSHFSQLLHHFVKSSTGKCTPKPHVPQNHKNILYYNTQQKIDYHQSHVIFASNSNNVHLKNPKSRLKNAVSTTKN